MLVNLVGQAKERNCAFWYVNLSWGSGMCEIWSLWFRKSFQMAIRQKQSCTFDGFESLMHKIK